MGGDVPMVLKRKSMDSRLKISGMTREEVITPEWFYEGSKLFKDKNIWIPDKRFRE